MWFSSFLFHHLFQTILERPFDEIAIHLPHTIADDSWVGTMLERYAHRIIMIIPGGDREDLSIDGDDVQKGSEMIPG